MCHLGLGLLEIETTNKAVIQNMNKPVLAWAETMGYARRGSQRWVAV
jgi:hypothetical protein